jgi:replication factor A1
MVVEDTSGNVADLTPNLREVNMKVTVVSKNPIRHVGSRVRLDTHRVCDVLVDDETGSVYLTLWDNAIEKGHKDDVVKIENDYMKLFRGSMRVNIEKYGTLTVLEASSIQDMNTEHNLSNQPYSQQRRFSNDFRWYR